MDIIELIARSEWPLVVGGVVLMFRRPIREMINGLNVKKVDAWGFTAEFERGLDKVEVLTLPISKDRTPKIESGNSVGSRNESPERKILQEWNRLDTTIRQLAVEAGKDKSVLKRSMPLPSVAEGLELDPDGIELIMVLRKLRDDVAHATAPPLSVNEAERFSSAVEGLLFYLKEKTAAARFGLTPPGPSAK